MKRKYFFIGFCIGALCVSVIVTLIDNSFKSLIITSIVSIVLSIIVLLLSPVIDKIKEWFYPPVIVTGIQQRLILNDDKSGTYTTSWSSKFYETIRPKIAELGAAPQDQGTGGNPPIENT